MVWRFPPLGIPGERAIEGGTNVATKSSSRSGADAAQETVERIRELNERIIENARQAGAAYLDVYERSLAALVDYQKSFASATPIDWLQRVIEAQAAFTRELGDLYAATAREAVKN
jgi:Phasin protein